MEDSSYTNQYLCDSTSNYNSVVEIYNSTTYDEMRLVVLWILSCLCMSITDVCLDQINTSGYIGTFILVTISIFLSLVNLALLICFGLCVRYILHEFKKHTPNLKIVLNPF
jgi:uncharacterized membrane protein